MSKKVLKLAEQEIEAKGAPLKNVLHTPAQRVIPRSYPIV